MVRQALEDAVLHGHEAPGEALALELQRLDALQAALWNEAASGNVAAVDRVLRIMERRARLLNLDSGFELTEAMNRLGDALARLKARAALQHRAGPSDGTSGAPPRGETLRSQTDFLSRDGPGDEGGD